MIDQLKFEYYEVVDSTNDRIKERARDGEEAGLVVTAGHQTAGKGRVGRKWESPTGESVSTSLLLRPDEIPISAVPTITIICGMAVRSAIEKLYGLDCQIKWPNDIVLNGKKICGILVEMEAEHNRVKYAVAGIGVNVHQSSFPEEIAFKATSIDIELMNENKAISTHRNDVAQEIWRSFKEYYNIFEKTADLSGLRQEYEKHLVNIGERVRIEDPQGAYEAVSKGITNAGALIVEADGIEKIIDSGEVSVRGLYGYV